MPQLHFSVDDETAERLAQQAAAKNLSLSKYIATLVTRTLGEQWPRGYLRHVVGSCKGTGLVEPPELPSDDVDL